MISIFSMPDGSEISSEWVKWLTFHLLISHKVFPSISLSLLLFQGAISCSDSVSIILLVRSHAKFPLLPSTFKGTLRSTLRDGKQQAYRAQFKEMSFPILFAVHHLLGVSQAFPFCINQLRPERRVKSKARPLLIFSIAPCPTVSFQS